MYNEYPKGYYEKTKKINVNIHFVSLEYWYMYVLYHIHLVHLLFYIYRFNSPCNNSIYDLEVIYPHMNINIIYVSFILYCLEVKQHPLKQLSCNILVVSKETNSSYFLSMFLLYFLLYCIIFFIYDS